MKQGAKYVGGFLLAVLLFWIVLRGKDPAEIGAALAKASLSGLVVASVLNLGHNYFRVVRWGLLLRPVKERIGFRPRFSAVLLGYLTTWTIPGRLGELVRPALLSSREKIPLGPCIGSVLADRLLDGVAIVVLFFAAATLSPLPQAAGSHAAAIRATTFVFVLVIAALILLLLAAGFARHRLSAWLERRSSRAVRWLGRTLLSLTAGTEALRQPSLVVPILVHSLLAWLTIALGTWIGVRAAGADVPFQAILILLPPLALGVALPTPGGAGGYHAAMSLGLVHLFGVPEAAAVSAGILMHLAVTIPVIAVGLVLLKVEGIAWKDTLRVVRQIGDLGATPAPTTDRPAECVR